MKNENDNMGNCIECGKLIYCGCIKEPLCRECAEIANITALGKLLRGDEE